ncbi:hypothetical protein ACIGDI_05355 [Streptomyces sp. NPDC085900]|uniref:hypothetical protein n=1 Tax=Streptomyces sp. NPDC085900 TaxID=3365737 RepID=UPI0037CE54E1
MDIAHYIALVDELCFRPFPAGRGDHEAELEVSHGLRGGDLAERAVTAEQYRKYRDAMYDRLASRWGEREPFNLQTVLLRTAEEEIPEPWASLSARADVAYLWEVPDTARWVAVAVADRDVTDEVQLVAVVTEAAPP